MTRFHGPNVVSCEVVRGTYRTPIIGAYLLPTTLDHLPDIEEALEQFRGQDPILMGDLNVDLDEAQNQCSQLVANMLLEFGLIDLMHHFRQHRRFRHLKTWTQIRQGTVLMER